MFLILPNMRKICLIRILDATFLDCLALTFCDVIGELLPEWDCLTLQVGTTFLLTSKLADIPVSRVRKGNPTLVSMICDIHDSASLVVDCKSWTLGWDSLVPSTMLITLPRGYEICPFGSLLSFIHIMLFHFHGIRSRVEQGAP